MFGVDMISSWRKRLTVYVRSIEDSVAQEISTHSCREESWKRTIGLQSMRLQGEESYLCSQVAEGAKGWAGLRTKQ